MGDEVCRPLGETDRRATEASKSLLSRFNFKSSTPIPSESSTVNLHRSTARSHASVGSMDWQARPSVMPVILQERVESVTVLECVASRITQLKLRCCTRQELLSLAAGATLPGTEWLPQLRLRDLRRLDPATAQHSPPALILRRGVLLASVSRLGPDSRGSINCLIRHDRCFFVARSPEDASVRAVHELLVRLSSVTTGEGGAAIAGAGASSSGGGGMRAGAPGVSSGGAGGSTGEGSASVDAALAMDAPLPFEFLALEAVLLFATDALSDTAGGLARLVDSETGLLAPSSGGGGLLRASAAAEVRVRLRGLATRAAEELTLARALADAISKPLEDECMHGLCLTDHAAGTGGGGRGGGAGASAAACEAPGAADAEVLLEAYHHEVRHVLAALRQSSRALERAHAEVSFAMDAARNRLLHFEVVATSVGTAMSVGAVISGVLGMNLRTPIFNQDDWLFDAVVVAIAVLCLITFVVLIWLQRGAVWSANRARARNKTEPTGGGGQRLLTINRPMSERPPTWQHAGAPELPGAAAAAVRDSVGAIGGGGLAWD